jgi:glucose-6-phosphate-specific signal transduction histidine kinase
MKAILITGSIVLPLIMFYSQKTWRRLRLIYNLVTIIALLVFGNIASLSVYQIIKDKTVFMTAIHAIFLNPLFLISGAYIGIYVLYRMLLLSIEEKQK